MIYHASSTNNGINRKTVGYYQGDVSIIQAMLVFKTHEAVTLWAQHITQKDPDKYKIEILSYEEPLWSFHGDLTGRHNWQAALKINVKYYKRTRQRTFRETDSHITRYLMIENIIVQDLS